jgi:penicillin amidase
LNGVTLPGAPVLVAGSNGQVAWGFTNSDGLWLHMERVQCTAVGDGEMRTPSGRIPLAVQREEIRVHGAPSVSLPVRSGSAGVLFEVDEQQRICWFARWLAQDPAATNIGIIGLERVTTVAQAVALAPSIGIPHQNLVVGDRQGHIGWSIAGRVPAPGENRIGVHSSWCDPQTQPHIMDPAVGRLWTANARVTDDPAQEAAIGGDATSVGGDYDLGARAQQIRADLLAIRGRADPNDMLRIQLDDRAVFLERWRTFLLTLLDADSLAGHPERAEFRRLLATPDMRASVDSVAYRLVHAYHERIASAVWQMLLRALNLAPNEESLPNQFEAALWTMVNEQPVHMLAASYASWRQFLLAQLDATIAGLQANCGALAHCTWGARKPVRIRHPLSQALPFLATFLDMPEIELPGDHNMPRVQDGPTGASERFAVSPGHEAQGYIDIPGGQSGHPLSPYYRAGFMDWARGRPLPFLPGIPQHRLTLQPD